MTINLAIKNLIAIGSHSDLLPKETVDKKVQKISAIHSEQVDMDYFTLNCCKPRSKEFEDIKSKIVQLTKDSPRYKPSIEGSVLLGLLEKDFSNVQLLFSEEAEFLEAISFFNIGILPKSLLEKLLPQHITKECLVQLQYCQEICQQDLGYFPSLTQPDSFSALWARVTYLCSHPVASATALVG